MVVAWLSSQSTGLAQAVTVVGLVALVVKSQWWAIGWSVVVWWLVRLWCEARDDAQSTRVKDDLQRLINRH